MSNVFHIQPRYLNWFDGIRLDFSKLTVQPRCWRNWVIWEWFLSINLHLNVGSVSCLDRLEQFSSLFE
jgi:hypothetical protein